MTVSASLSRGSSTSHGPRSPSMIQLSRWTSVCWTSIHSFRGVATSPGRQNSWSSSMTGIWVSEPRQRARTDLPAPPRLRMTTRCIAQIVSIAHASSCCGLAASASNVRVTPPEPFGDLAVERASSPTYPCRRPPTASLREEEQTRLRKRVSEAEQSWRGRGVRRRRSSRLKAVRSLGC